MELSDLKKQFEDFQDQTADDRRLAERDRDYLDHKQWTAREVAVLKRRGQAPVVNNRIKKKHQFLKGLEIRSRTDPKAYPRTPKHEQDADAITDALRFVEENSRLDRVFTACSGDFFCEGIEAVIVELDSKKEIIPRKIPWDRFYYDYHSREEDFSDATYLGITTWLDRSAVKSMFPGKEKEIDELCETDAIDTSFLDRPRWYDRVGSKRHRLRVNEHYFKDGGTWKLAFFTGDLLLSEVEDSPTLDEHGEPCCPIIAESAYVDRENNRYGVVRGDIWLQDEINHRRSKALHMLSNVTVKMEKGAVESAQRLLDQLSSGKAVIEYSPGMNVEVDHNTELAQGQVALYQDAKSELDDSVVQTVGSAGRESGRSKLVDRENDIDELADLFERHKDFRLRVYRQIWAAIKQHWTEERWVRVTDDERNIRFVGLNKPVTGRDIISQRAGIAPEMVESVLAENGIGMMPGQMERVVGVENEVSKMDIDIILDESPDVVTIQQEQFQVLAKLAEAYGPEHVPFDEVLKLSSLRNKDEFLERTKGDGEAQQMAAQQAQQIQLQGAMSEIEERQSKTALNIATARERNVKADQAQAETALALAGRESIG